MPISNNQHKGQSEQRGDEATQDACHAQRRMKVTYTIRRQAPHEERRFMAAIDAFLSELVRQEMGRRD